MNTLHFEIEEPKTLSVEIDNLVQKSGTSNYNDLQNKPQINGVTLQGNILSSNLGIENYDDTEVKQSITNLNTNKADKSNTYTKTEVDTKVGEAETIAKGRATGYVFDTKTAMDEWIANNTDKLVLGDNLYIRALNVPDYWWDGTKAQELETQKVDLTEYATKNYVDNLITGALEGEY